MIWFAIIFPVPCLQILHVHNIVCGCWKISGDTFLPAQTDDETETFGEMNSSLTVKSCVVKAVDHSQLNWDVFH